ncbi:MAG: hypothetical protein R3E02_01900 [Blastomonas sp.]
MDYHKEIARIPAMLARIDTEPHFTRMAELREQIASEEAAIERGRERIDAINKLKAEIELNGPDGNAAADALRADADVLTFVKDIDKLETERVTILAGIKKLNRKIDDLKHELQDASDKLKTDISEALLPLAQPLAQRIDDAAREMLSAYVDAVALAEAFNVEGTREIEATLLESMTTLNARHILRQSLPSPEVSPKIVEAITSHRNLIHEARFIPRTSVKL